MAFKSAAKAFVRTYGFLSAILPYSNPWWEKLSIFLDFLIPKLPAPVDEDPTAGILETIDMESYRAEKREAMKIALPDEDAGIPTPCQPQEQLASLIPNSDGSPTSCGASTSGSGTSSGRTPTSSTSASPSTSPKVAADEAYQNAQANNDPGERARVEHDKALMRVMVSLMKDDTELFKQFMDNPSFKDWLAGRGLPCDLREGGLVSSIKLPALLMGLEPSEWV